MGIALLTDGNLSQTGDDSSGFPDISGIAGVSTIVVGTGTYQKVIYDIGDKTLFIHGTLFHNPMDVILVGSSNNMIHISGDGLSNGFYDYRCDVRYASPNTETLTNVIGIYNTTPQNPWHGNGTLPQPNPSIGVVTVDKGAKWDWKGAGIVAPSGFHYGEGSSGVIENALFISENDNVPLPDRHYISFLNSDDININGLRFIGGEFINRSTNLNQSGITRSQSAIAIFPNRVTLFTTTDPVFDGTNTVDVPIQTESLPGQFTRSKIFNPSNGSLMVIVGGEANSSNKNFGYVEILKICKMALNSGLNIVEGKYYIRDTNNSNRKNHNDVDDREDKTYKGSINGNGQSTEFSVVTCIVNVESGANPRGVDNHGLYTKDLRGLTNVLGEDLFDFNFIAYNHLIKRIRRSLSGNGVLEVDDLVEADLNIGTTPVATVRDRLLHTNAMEVYEAFKLLLVDNYQGEENLLVTVNDSILDFGDADVHIIERRGLTDSDPPYSQGVFYVTSEEKPGFVDPTLKYSGNTGDTFTLFNGNTFDWSSFYGIDSDWRISYITAGDKEYSVSGTTLNYNIPNNTIVVHLGNQGSEFEGGIKTSGRIFNTAGVIIRDGVFDDEGDSVLSFRNFHEWRLYTTESERDDPTSTPLAEGERSDQFRFTYSPGLVYYHWTRVSADSPWIPFFVTIEESGLTVVGVTGDEILLSSLASLQSLPRHLRLDTSLDQNGDGYIAPLNSLEVASNVLSTTNITDVTVLTNLKIDRDITERTTFIGGSRYTRVDLSKAAVEADPDEGIEASPEEIFDTTSVMYKTCTVSGKQGGTGMWFTQRVIHKDVDNLDGIHENMLAIGTQKPRDGCTLIILGMKNAQPDHLGHIIIDGSNFTESKDSTILITDVVGEVDFINFNSSRVTCEIVGRQALLHILSDNSNIDLEYIGEHPVDIQGDALNNENIEIDIHTVVDEVFDHLEGGERVGSLIKTSTSLLRGSSKIIYFNNLPQSDPNYVGDGSNRRPYQTWEEVTERLESDNIDKVVLQTDVTFPADIDPAFSLLIEGRDGKPIVNFNGQAYPRRYTYYNVDFRGITLNANEPFTTYDSASIGKGDSFTEAPTHLNGDHYRLTAGYIEPSAGCNLTLHDLRGKDGKLVLDLDLLTTEPTETPKIHIPNFLGHELRIKNLIPQGSVNIYIHAPDARVIIENNVSESLGTEGNTLIQVSSNYEVQNLTATATQKDLDDNDILDLDGNPIIIKKRVEVGAVGLSVGEKDEVRVKFLPKALQGDIVRDGFKVGIQTIEELTRLLTFHNVGTIELQSDYKMPSGFDYAISALWLGKTDILDTEIVTLDGNHTDMRSYEFEDMRLSGGFSGNAPFKTIGCRFKDFGIKIVSTTETDPVTLIETTTVTRTVEGGINGTHENVTFESEGNRFTDQCKVVCNEVYTTGGTLNLNGEGLTSGSDLTFNDVHASNIIIKNVASGLTLFVDCPNSNVTIDDSVDADANITLVCNGTITGDETKATVVRTTSESSVVSGDVDCSGFTIL